MKTVEIIELLDKPANKYGGTTGKERELNRLFSEVVIMVKNKENFRKMNCDDCQCNVCQGVCMACHECYRAEYAKEDWEDFYYPYDSKSKECHEF